jgi:hypothetical protein
VEEPKSQRGFKLIFAISALAILLAIIQLADHRNSLAIYNFGRAIVFALACVYLHRNSTKIDFVGPLKLRVDGNAGDLNVKISYFLSYLFSVINLAISTALYLNP